MNENYSSSFLIALIQIIQYNTDNTGDAKMKFLIKGNQELYIDIANQIERFIELGIYKINEALPSCRKLGMEINVNPNTVQKAYEYLEKKGIVYSIPKKGYYINEQHNNLSYDLNKLEFELKNILKQGYSKKEIIDCLNNIKESEEN